MKFRKILNKLMIDAGIDQKVLAQKLGMSPQAVSVWIVHNKMPPEKKLQQLAEIFNVPVGVFYEDNEPIVDEVITISKREYILLVERNELAIKVNHLLEQNFELYKRAERTKNADAISVQRELTDSESSNNIALN